MKLRATILTRAEFDEAEIYKYLAQYSAATAQRFVDSVDETLLKLRATAVPGMPWPTENPRLSGLRWTKVVGFSKHLMFFRIVEDTIEVVRILHGARDIEAILGGDE